MARRIILLLFLFFVAGTSFLLLDKNTSDSIPKSAPQLQNQSGSIERTNFGAEYIIAGNLDIPWAIAFLPNRDLILTQRKGKVLIISGDLRSKPREITQINNVKAQGEGDYSE